MLVKFKITDGGFKYYENVKEFTFSQDKIRLPESFRSAYTSDPDQLMSIVRTEVDKLGRGIVINMEWSSYDPIEFLKTEIIVLAKDIDVIFDHEIYRKVFFWQEGRPVLVLTDGPVFLCNDEGKTIDSIR